MKTIYKLLISVVLCFFLLSVTAVNVFAGYEAQYGEDLHPSDFEEVSKPLPTTVYMNVEESESGEVAVYVSIKDIGRPLFGAAFNLIYDNGILDYKKYEIGDLFNSANNTDFDPMILVNHDRDKLITGLSLKRGDELINEDGKLIIFYFKRRARGEIDLNFSNGVLASMVDGERRDFLDVEWEDYQGNEMGNVDVYAPIDSQWKLYNEIGYFAVVFVSSIIGAALFVLGYNMYVRRSILKNS